VAGGAFDAEMPTALQRKTRQSRLDVVIGIAGDANCECQRWSGVLP